MIFNRYAGCLSLIVALLGLSGCPGNDENTTQSGLTVHVAETHSETKPGVTPAGVSSLQNSASIHSGYDQNNLGHHDILDNSGHVLSLYRAYLVLNDVELVPCTSLSQLPRRLLESVISSAEAHAGHGSEPVGGRALDKPNVIDIVTQDEFILPLGDIAIAPGRYCGLRASVVQLASDGYGKPAFAAASNDNPTTQPEIPELAGLTFSIKADYCAVTNGAGECLQRNKVDIDDSGLTSPGVQTINFDQPLELNANLREAYIAVGIAYGDWVRNLDITQLSSNTNERQKLLDNMAASIHIHAKGLGDLPVNVAP